MRSHSQLVDAFADSKRRNQAILDLVGAINANDLRRLQVSDEAKRALIAGLDHPNAKVALLAALETNPDPRVREEARLALGAPGPLGTPDGPTMPRG